MKPNPLLFLFVAFTLHGLFANDAFGQRWRIKVSSSDKAVIYKEDGSISEESESRKVRGIPSPDRKRVAYINTLNGDAEIFVADSDGKNERQLTRNDSIDNFPSWTPDGKRLVFASTRKGTWQIFSMNLEGKDVQQLTNHKVGAWRPKVGPDGTIAYLGKYESRGKLRPVDLCLLKKDKSKKLVEKTFMTDFEWSPNGSMIAYGTLGEINFREIQSGKNSIVTFKNIDKRLYSHGTSFIKWRPDNQAVVCSITFLGGRFVGTTIFGDHELFVIPIAGKPSWFTPKSDFQNVEWIK